jgi:hypothetical protein
MPLELVGELSLTNLTERYSLAGLSLSTAFYEPRIVAFGDLSREIPVVPDQVRLSDSSVTLANHDNHFSKLRADNSFKNAGWKYLLGDPAVGGGDFTAIFDGKIDNWAIEGDVCTFDFRGVGFPRLQLPVCKRINVTRFPWLPDGTPRACIPYVLGKVSSVGLTDDGALPAYLIDPAMGQAKYRYIAAEGTLRSVDNVYKYGAIQTTGFAVSQQTLSGTVYTVIDFDADPRDSTRKNEREITYDADGIAKGGNSQTNPVDQLETVLLRMGYVAGELNATSFADNAITAASRGILTGLAATADETLEDVIRNLSESANLSVFEDKSGKVSVALPASTPTSTAGLTKVDWIAHIVKDSFVVAGQSDIATGATYVYARNYVTGEWDSSNNFRDLLQQGKIGEAIEPEWELPYIRSDGPAGVVTTERLFYLREERQAVSVETDITLFKSIEIGDNILLTHIKGVASDGGGYVDQVMRVLGMELINDPLAPRLRLTLVDLVGASFNEANEFLDWQCDPAYWRNAQPALQEFWWRTSGEPIYGVTKV